MLINKILIGTLLLSSTGVFAGEVIISDAWARASAPGQKNGSVALIITSPQDARLVAVSSSSSASAEIHTMSIDKGVMKMRELQFLSLPAHKAVSLGPGGDHLMLFDLKKPLKEGDEVQLTLSIEFADKSKEKFQVKAQVRPLISGQSKQHH